VLSLPSLPLSMVSPGASSRGGAKPSSSLEKCTNRYSEPSNPVRRYLMQYSPSLTKMGDSEG
jgi:hypothetical protein